jgi:hypothetical protein
MSTKHDKDTLTEKKKGLATLRNFVQLLTAHVFPKGYMHIMFPLWERPGVVISLLAPSDYPFPSLNKPLEIISGNKQTRHSNSIDRTKNRDSWSFCFTKCPTL